MNPLALNISMFLCLLSLTCSKKVEEPLKSSLYTGETTFEFNQDSTTYCTYGSMGQSIGVEGIYIFNDLILGGVLTNSLVFFIPGDSGVYTASEEVDFENRYARVRYYYTHADVLLASYYIPEEKTNGTVSILQFDQTSGKISGNFQYTLYLKENYDLNDAPDSLVFRNGHFETIVME